MTTETEQSFPQMGIFIQVKNNDVNKALRKMKKLIQSEGIMQELRKRECYEKPSISRRKEKTRAIRRWQKRRKELEEVL